MEDHVGAGGKVFQLTVHRPQIIPYPGAIVSALCSLGIIDRTICHVNHLQLATSQRTVLAKAGGSTNGAPGAFGVGHEATLFDKDGEVEFIQFHAVDEAHARVAGMADGEPGVRLCRSGASRIQQKDFIHERGVVMTGIKT